MLKYSVLVPLDGRNGNPLLSDLKNEVNDVWLESDQHVDFLERQFFWQRSRQATIVPDPLHAYTFRPKAGFTGDGAICAPEPEIRKEEAGRAALPSARKEEVDS